MNVVSIMNLRYNTPVHYRFKLLLVKPFGENPDMDKPCKADIELPSLRPNNRKYPDDYWSIHLRSIPIYLGFRTNPAAHPVADLARLEFQFRKPHHAELPFTGQIPEKLLYEKL
jgi:hypothetical protein